jgi:hypothetical protein
MAQHHRDSNANPSSAFESIQPTTPEPMPPVISVSGSLQAPPPQPLRIDSLQRRQWRRDRESENVWQQERSEQQRREYLWRKQFELHLERQRLDGEEQSLQQAWDTLPQPASRLSCLLIMLVMIAGSITLVALYPALVIPLIIILLIVARRRRRHRWQPGPRADWVAQERYRIQSRIAWIDARITSIKQEEQSIAQELLASGASQEEHPQR